MTRSHYSERHNLWMRARDPHPIKSWSKNVSINPKIPTHDWSHCLFHSPLWKMKTIVEMMVKLDLYITNHTISRHERKTLIVIYFIFWVCEFELKQQRNFDKPHTQVLHRLSVLVYYISSKTLLGWVAHWNPLHHQYIFYYLPPQCLSVLMLFFR